MNQRVVVFLIAFMFTGCLYSKLSLAADGSFQQSILTMTDEQIQALTERQVSYSDLVADEWQRYIELMQGPLGFWNPSIDPLLALGMYAETVEQEQQYAERFAKQEYALTTRALQFQRAYQAAFDRLYPNMPLTHRALLKPYELHRQAKQPLSTTKQVLPAPSITAGDKLRVFVTMQCQSCKRLITRLLTHVAPLKNVRIDIFILDAHSDNAIHKWAQKQAIDSHMLRDHKVTLNRDDGLLAQLQTHTDENLTEPPFIFIQRNAVFYQLRISDFTR